MIRKIIHIDEEYIMDNGLCLEEFILLYDPDRIYVPGLN